MTHPTETQHTESPRQLEKKQEKAQYETPQLIVHGKVEKMTLQTGGGPGGGGSTLF